MGFHRLTVPSYTGGLPGGYDYINNATSGTPANADGAKVGGTNAGSYFVGLSDDATSEATNRPHRALAENCDFLDDLFHRSIAIRTSGVFGTGGSPASSVVVTDAGQYFGESGLTNNVEGIATFAEVVDASGDPLIVDGVVIRIASVTGATVGGGFTGASAVTYNFTDDIPAGTTYRLIYSKRGNLATLPINHFSQYKIRNSLASKVSYAGAVTSWAGGGLLPPSTVQEAIDGIISELAGTGGSEAIGSDALPAWLDTTNIVAAPLFDQLSGIVQDLSAFTGAAKVGITTSPNFADGTPLSAGSVTDQVHGIVTRLATGDGAGQVRYNGGPAWADSSTNPATTVGDQLDKILTDLAGTGGAAKIGYAGGGAWADSSTNPATTIELQLDKIVSDLAATTGAAKIGFGGSSTWADGTTNPAGTVEGQLDHIQAVLSASAAPSRLGAAPIVNTTGKNPLTVAGADLGALLTNIVAAITNIPNRIVDRGGAGDTTRVIASGLANGQNLVASVTIPVTRAGDVIVAHVRLNWSDSTSYAYLHAFLSVLGGLGSTGLDDGQFPKTTASGGSPNRSICPMFGSYTTTSQDVTAGSVELRVYGEPDASRANNPTGVSEVSYQYMVIRP